MGQTTKCIQNILDDLINDVLGYAHQPVAPTLSHLPVIRDQKTHWCRRCGVTVGPGEASSTGCGSCRGTRLPWSQVVRMDGYEDPLRSLILQVKFGGRERLGIGLGRLLGRALLDEMGDQDLGGAIVVPMPMPPARRWYRGIDHAACIAHGVGLETGFRIVSCLAKQGGVPQVARPRSERRRLGGRGMTLSGRKRRRISGRRVVLIDDVLTTGASLRGASRILFDGGALAVLAGVLAVSNDPLRGASLPVGGGGWRVDGCPSSRKKPL